MYEAEVKKGKKEPLEKIRLDHQALSFVLLGVGTTFAVLVFLCELRRGKCELVLNMTYTDWYNQLNSKESWVSLIFL